MNSGIDYTIVNPAHLPRTLADSVCQQCHLLGKASPDARGRKPTDFRPGLPLQEFRHAYGLAVASQGVIGHVEQMQLSRCYQRSETLSCITCHNPHAEPDAAERVAFYRAACLECHAPERCTVDIRLRQKDSPNNDCVQCHMPRSATDIPHVAFTNHRIGVHQPSSTPQAADETAGLGELRPILDLSGLGAIDRDRSLGLADAEFALLQNDPAQARACRARAAERLTGVRAAGLRDPVVDVMLVRLGYDAELLRPYLGSVVSADLTPQDRCAALSLYAQVCAKQGRCAEAIPLLRQLVRLRRASEDWQMLAYCERTLGNIPQSVEAVEKAATIDTRLEGAHELLAPYYRQRGDLPRAAWHQRRASQPAP